MPAPRKTTGTTRMTPERRTAWRRRQFDERVPPSDAEPCEICGKPISPLGRGSHKRRHVLDGDIPPTEPTKPRVREAPPRKIPNLPRPERDARHTFVSKIAGLPYEQFIQELLK